MLQSRGKKKNRKLSSEEVQRRFKEWHRGNLLEGKFYLPPPVYEGLIQISHEKYVDVNHLKQFCQPEAADYFSKLPYVGKQKD